MEVSPEFISRVTESVIEDVRQWRNRPLEKSYLILFLDALRVNSRQDGKNTNKALYVAPAINWEGKKEVLGLWLADTEGAKFWIRSPRKADMYNHFLAVQAESLMNVLTDIKNRSTNDILIAFNGRTYRLSRRAQEAIFPDTHIQHCIVHIIRSSTKFFFLQGFEAGLPRPEGILLCSERETAGVRHLRILEKNGTASTR